MPSTASEKELREPGLFSIRSEDHGHETVKKSLPTGRDELAHRREQTASSAQGVGKQGDLQDR